MLKHKLVDFIIQFMEEVDKEISEMKLFVRLSLLKGRLNQPEALSVLGINGIVADLLFDPAQCQGEICGGILLNTGIDPFAICSHSGRLTEFTCSLTKPYKRRNII